MRHRPQPRDSILPFLVPALSQEEGQISGRELQLAAKPLNSMYQLRMNTSTIFVR